MLGRKTCTGPVMIRISLLDAGFRIPKNGSLFFVASDDDDDDHDVAGREEQH